jgi:uncharacterized protein
MHFPISGVDCPVWLPPAMAFVLALVTAPAGVSGAFLLLPFQMSVLGFSSPGVTPTNLIYNVVALPGGILRYIQERRMDWVLTGVIVAGSLPGMCLGAMIRVRYLPDARSIKLFVALVLFYMGIRLVRDFLRGFRPAETASAQRRALPQVTVVSAVVGVIGGIYGVGGGALIAPYLMTILAMPVSAIAGAAMLGTVLTSVAGVGFFAFGMGVQPDWLLGLLFGAGGVFGSYCGARLQKRLPERWIRLFVGLLVLGLATAYTGVL